jgi:hypothetical protein
LIIEDSQKYIRNVHNTQLMVVKVGETAIPISVTDFHPENTYTVSPYSHYVSYGGLEEVKHLDNPLAEAAREALLDEAKLKPSQLDPIINASGMGEQAFPDTISLIQRQLGLGKLGIPAMTVHTTCLSFVAGMDVASNFITQRTLQKYSDLQCGRLFVWDQPEGA